MNEPLSTPFEPAAASPIAKPSRRLSVRIVLWSLIFGSGMVVGIGLTLIAVRQGALNAIHLPIQLRRRRRRSWMGR